MALQQVAGAGVPARGALVAYHLTHGAYLGIMAPYLALYFHSLSLSVTQVTMLMAIAPVMLLFAPPLWGSWGDRSGRLDRTLRLVSIGALGAFACFALTREFILLIGAVAFYEFFNAGKSPVLDGLVLQRISNVGGSYSHFRVFLSIAHMSGALSVAIFAIAVGPELMAVGCAFLVANLIASTKLRSDSVAPAATEASPGFAASLTTLSKCGLTVLLVCGCLHSIAQAPFDTTFGIHVVALGQPEWLPGVATGMATGAEITIMLVFPWLAARFSPRQLLCASFVASAVRWAILSVATSVPLLLAPSLLHAFSFGTFFLAGTNFVFERVPAHLRATAQGLFFSLSYGLGGGIGNLLSGVGYDLWGGETNFLVATGIELVATAIILMTRMPSRQAQAAATSPP